MVNAVFASFFFFSIYVFIEIYVVVFFFLRNVTQDARDVHRRQVNVRLRRRVRWFVGSLCVPWLCSSVSQTPGMFVTFNFSVIFFKFCFLFFVTEGHWKH